MKKVLISLALLGQVGSLAAAAPSSVAGGAALGVTIGSLDRGIFADLAPGVRIAAPSWPVAEGPTWLRLDPAHRLLTLYQGEVALTAYALVAEPAALQAATPQTDLATLAGWLGAEDAAELRTKVGAPLKLTVGAPPAYEDQDGDGLVNPLDVLVGAKKLCLNKATYSGSYRALKYPGGDVPRTEGVCTDTLVRALRNAGWDLQKGVHEDALRRPRLYPLEGKQPDANIDHRRIRMLLPWLKQFFVEVPKDAPYLPGDLVLFDTFPDRPGSDHAGIVADRLGKSGLPLIVNNWDVGYVEQEMDLLPTVPVTHRFRVPVKPRP